MATNRFGHSDDFVLKNKKVGINTSEPQEELEVVGDIKSYNLRVTGDSSLTTFEGFLSSNQNVDETLNVSTSTSSSLSGEIIIGDGVTATIEDGVTSSQGNIDSLKVYNTFTIPTGGTEDRPSKVKPGQLYYNVDFKTIEFWDGNVWRQVDNTTRSGRGVFSGGLTPSTTKTIDFINISSQGNAISFGSLINARYNHANASSETRGLFCSGTFAANTIEYITIASQGDGIDFGDLNAVSAGSASACSSTRAVIAHGVSGPANSNVISYIQMHTLGNALDFGDRTVIASELGGVSSPTRGIFAGGGNPSGTVPSNVIDFVTITTTGNAVSFGNLVDRHGQLGGGCGNSVRGLFAGGLRSPVSLNIIQYITIATTGNAINFGDLSIRRAEQAAAASNSIRGTFAGGSPNINSIEYVTIASTGNSQDFGDLTVARQRLGGGQISDSHGGLGGF